MAEEAVEAVFRAARESDVGEVARLLDAQPDLMEANHPTYQWSLLYEAARNGQGEVAKMLLKRGADVNRCDPDGRTALYAAATFGHEEVASLFLRAGADITRRGYPAAWTTLTAASFWNHVGVTRLLLRHIRGKGLDDRGRGGETALWWACHRRHAEICRALLLAGADHTIADDSGRTPRQAAQLREDNPCTAVFEVGALTTSHPHSNTSTTEWDGPYLIISLLFPCGSGGTASWSVRMLCTGPGKCMRTAHVDSRPLEAQCRPT
jgi:ankyrin repeat protein